MDHFNITELLICHQNAGLVPELDEYSKFRVLDLLNRYVREELIYLPGAVLTFTGKLFSAKAAFNRLLSLQC